VTATENGASPTQGGRPLPSVKATCRDLVDHVQADLWATPQSFNDPSLLPGHEKHAILSPLGVAGMEELGVGLVAWRKLSGGATVALLVGSDARNNRSLPGDIIAGSLTERTSPDDVDGPHSKELGILQRGDRAETNGEQVTMGIPLSVLVSSRARFQAAERHDHQLSAVAAAHSAWTWRVRHDQRHQGDWHRSAVVFGR
jgi:hypothetical protein